VLHFGLKFSKSRQFLGALTTLLRLPSREGLLAFGNRSFAPSTLNPPLAPKEKYPPVSPKHKILEPPLGLALLAEKILFFSQQKTESHQISH